MTRNKTLVKKVYNSRKKNRLDKASERRKIYQFSDSEDDSQGKLVIVKLSSKESPHKSRMLLEETIILT